MTVTRRRGGSGGSGEDGLTPFIGGNGHWWIGDTDTGVPAEGPEGPEGPQGPIGPTGPSGGGGGGGGDVLRFSRAGLLSPSTGTMPIPIPVGRTLAGVWIVAGVAPTGAGIVVDIKLNGSTIFTGGQTKPTIAANATVGSTVIPNSPVLPDASVLKCDIVSVGSTFQGQDLAVVAW